MPEGDRSIIKQALKTPSILNNLFSFFKFKRSISNDLVTQEQQNINSWADCQTLKAEDVMIPRTDIVAINYNNSLEEIGKIFLRSRHTRMPVYKGELDTIIGFINIKDILPFLLEPASNIKFNIEHVIRNLLIISPSMKIFDLLEEMRKTRTHIALVVDEFGGIDGLITIEDLVEEFIGRIDDEHDLSVEDEIKELPNHKLEVNGRLEIGFLEEKLKMHLSDGDKYDTVGGLILSISGHVPEKGEIITHQNSGLVFEILDSDPRRIKKVIISFS